MKPDLTRWNRAGLRRFRYVDGNAVTYLEMLRRELLARFSSWDMDLLGIQLESGNPEEEPFGKDYQQAIDNYRSLNDQRGKIALEIIRSFARATHVLTEHLDAYANEGFLGTATQWENVRRLVHGLSYHPGPPASAMTHLVLYAKPEQAGLVSRGLQIKHTPEDKSPVVFETLEEIQVDPAFNALQLENWNRSQDKIENSKELRLDCIVDGLKPGDPVVIENAGKLQSHWLRRVFVEDECTILVLSGSVSGKLCDLRIHLNPIEKLEIFAPLGQQITKVGTSNLLLEEEPTPLQKKLTRGSEEEKYVFIGSGNEGVYRRVIGVDGKRIHLQSAIAEGNLKDLNLPDCYVGMPGLLEVALGTNNHGNATVKGSAPWLLGADVFISHGGGRFSAHKVSVAEAGTESDVTYLKLEGDAISGGGLGRMLVPPGANEWKWRMDSFVELSAQNLKVSTIKRMARDELCVVGCDSNLVAARIENITEEGAGRSGLQVASWEPKALAEKNENFLRSQTTVFGKFKEQARLQGWNINETEVRGANSKRVVLHDKAMAGKLKTGRLLVIEHEPPDATGSFLTSVLKADGETGELLLKDALPESPENSKRYQYRTGKTVIRANVVLAGHGETQPEKILGSGNATLSNQEFLFPVSNVSFVSDSRQTSGVRADISIIVDGETWTQVPHFNSSQATDVHYVVRMTEEGHLQIIFGDGVHGRRLPTGENNVRIAWRMGSGADGNFAEGLLEKPAHPHPRVEAVSQPFRSGGGSDVESVSSLRRSAPASLLTMERAVSANDFAQLAESHARVWRARAGLESQGREQIVSVIVVPADGFGLDTFEEELEGFLLGRAIPGIRVKLKPYAPVILRLLIVLDIDETRFDREDVQAEVQKTLLERFTLKNRTIGAPVYLSDIYQCVGAIRGVEYSVCKFVDAKGAPIKKQDEEVQALHPDREYEVIHMDSGDCIRWTTEEEE